MKVAKEEEEFIMIPTDAQDSRLPKAAVCAMFGATSAIKYRITKDDGTTGWRGLLLEHGQFYPPEDGWQERTYIVVQTDRKYSCPL